MTISPVLLGLVCVAIAVLLTFVFPIQRQRFSNQLWDFITLGLFVAGLYFVNYYDPPSNLILGGLIGAVAILIRDFRLWVARFKSQAYRRSHRYHWYGRAHTWYEDRRQRRRY